MRDSPYTGMHVGVPSLLASVVMFYHMCNRPSAKGLCVKYCTITNSKGSILCEHAECIKEQSMRTSVCMCVCL